MIDNHFSVIGDIDHIERMQTIFPVYIDRIVTVLQHINHSGRTIIRGWYYSMKSEWCMLYIGIVLHIVEQVKTELVQSEVHYRHSCIHFLYVYHFFLQAFQLFTAVFQVAFFLVRKRIVIACRCHNRHFHACLYSSFKVDIFIKSHVRPVIDKLYHIVAAAYTVYSSETLYYADRIPVDIVIYQIVAILKVLPFAYTVGRYKYIYTLCDIRKYGCFLLRYRRKQRKNCIEIKLLFQFQSAACFYITGYQSRMQSCLFEYP